MHEITKHCAYLFCLNSYTFEFSCKEDYYVNEEKYISNVELVFYRWSGPHHLRLHYCCVFGVYRSLSIVTKIAFLITQISWIKKEFIFFMKLMFTGSFCV